MAKIVTLTFNPCIDKNTTVDGIVPEKKLRCSRPSFGPGGGGINVSRAIHNLGGHSVAIYPAGGYSGKFLVALMEGEGLDSHVVETRNHTRENFIVVDSVSHKQYRFGMPGNPIEEGEWLQLLQKVEEMEFDYLVASGSLLPGMPEDIIARVAGIAKRKGSRLVVDTSGAALERSLEVGVFMLKPNLAELSSLVGREEVEESLVDELAREIIGLGKCEVIVVSMGSRGARLVTAGESIQVASPKVNMVSTLGAGDSMVAGMVLSLSGGATYKEALEFGVACGTAATITHGSELCRKEDVEQLVQRIRREREGKL